MSQVSYEQRRLIPQDSSYSSIDPYSGYYGSYGSYPQQEPTRDPDMYSRINATSEAHIPVGGAYYSAASGEPALIVAHSNRKQTNNSLDHLLGPGDTDRDRATT
ncbi:hypothetical protein LTS08_008454 [Lithohypha guttulata]|nr:hypothetical protein LTS08_008454 [Lithohypha guttulata]